MMNITDEELKQIEEITDLLEVAFQTNEVSFDKPEWRQAVKDSIAHHEGHLQSFGVTQAKVDPYKILTWIGYFFGESDNSQRPRIVESMLDTLNYCLGKETPPGGLDSTTKNYLHAYVLNEMSDQSDHGIGKNGVFMSFNCASQMKRMANKRLQTGWGGSASGWGGVR